MTEKELQAKILKALNKIPSCVAFPHVASPYSPTGHSDIYGTIYGYGFWGEVKLPGKKLTKIQQAFLDQVGKESIIINTFVWNSVEQAIRAIEQIDMMQDYYMG